MKKWTRIQVLIISFTFTDFFNIAELSNCFLSFFAYFYAKNWWDQEFFVVSLSLIVQIWVLSVKQGFFFSFWLIFCPLDPDPRSQNLADPKHCYLQFKLNPLVLHPTHLGNTRSCLPKHWTIKFFIFTS